MMVYICCSLLFYSYSSAVVCVGHEPSGVPLSWHVSPCGICDMSFVSLLPATATFL